MKIVKTILAGMVALTSCVLLIHAQDTEDSGILIGSFTTRNHLVAGDVYMLSPKVLEIRGFSYDGQGPAAFFWASTSATPQPGGIVLPDPGPNGNCAKTINDMALAEANGITQRIEFPEGTTIADYWGGSISVWCERFNANFGEFVIPMAADIPTIPGPGPSLECSDNEPVSLGSLTTVAHQVAGEVFLLSPTILEIRGYTYDGQGPAAFFWLDQAPSPTSNGVIAADGSPSNGCALTIDDAPLPEASAVTQRVELPAGTTIDDWLGGSLSVWCEQFAANFGFVTLPEVLPLPAPTPGASSECNTVDNEPDEVEVVADPVRLGDFITVQHLVAGEVWLLSEKVFEIRNFFYDGQGPAAYFWLTANPTPTASGIVAQDASPSNQCALTINDPALPEAMGTTQRVEIPGDLTINDFLGGSLAVWCEAFNANFGHFVIPAEIPGPMPGPVALECTDEEGESDIPQWIATPEGYNCEELNPTIGAANDAPFHVRWRVDGDMLDVELIGRLPEGEYFGFGISGATDRTEMIGADAQIADMMNGQPRVVDFFMDQRAQCSGMSGVCRDTAAEYTNDVGEVSADSQDGVTVIRYRKPIAPADSGLLTSSGVDVDQTVITEPGIEQYIVWAIGAVNPDTGNALFHGTAFATEDVTLEFGRQVADNCLPLITDGTFSPTAAPPEPWTIPRIQQSVTEITAHIGPSGGPRGYQAITGNSPWGIAWYLNGDLIPTLIMERGTTYNFLVSGGIDPTDDSNYHPFYLTDSARGGYFQLSPLERLDETPLAGVNILDADENGVYEFESTGVAPICRYETTANTSANALGPYPEWLSTVDTSCASDQTLMEAAAVVSFTPDENTPDKIFYHCITHFDLGWEILVVDEGATLSPTPTPTDEPEGLTVTALEGQLEGSTLSYIVNEVDPRANGEATVSFIYKAPAEAWSAIAFSDNGGFMVGSEAVIGLPDEGTVLKYNLNLQDTAGVIPFPDEFQTLIDASITQETGTTILRFTKIMVEDNEIPIALGSNTFLGAWGLGNSLSFHARRETFALNLESGGVQELSVGRQSLWKAHGWFASIAWGLLCPLAIGAGILRKMFVAPLWFQIHRSLNMLVIVFTVIAFSLAVAAINRETPAGASPDHFDPEPFAHRLTGLIVFVVSLIQAIGGIFRPHATEAGEKTTLIRKSFEFGHRFLGYSLLALAWYQVDSGIKIYQSIYLESQSTNLLAIFWGVAGGIAGLIFLGFLKIQFFDASKEESTPSNHKEKKAPEQTTTQDVESSEA